MAFAVLWTKILQRYFDPGPGLILIPSGGEQAACGSIKRKCEDSQEISKQSEKYKQIQECGFV